MYQSDDTYEPYPLHLNAKIEKSYRKKKPNVNWEEEGGGRFEVDFVRMIEQKVGSAAAVVKVKRESAGLLQYAVVTIRCSG